MNGREHLYWSLMSYSFVMFGYSIIFDYKDVGMLSYITLIGLFFLSILCLEFSNTIVSKMKHINKERNLGSKEERKKTTELKKQLKSSETMSEEESFEYVTNVEKQKEMLESSVSVASSSAGSKAKLTPLENKMVSRLRMLSFCFLIAIIFFVCYNSIPAVQDPSDLFIAYCMCAFGGRFPDFDRDIPDSMEFHRNPFTHSGMYGVPAGMIAIIMIANDVISTSKILFFIAFIIGITSHLVMDNIESESSFLDLARVIKNKERCPGNIRHIRKNRQRHWLFLHIFSLITMVVLLFSRYEMYSFTASFLSYDNYTYDFIMTTHAWTLLGFVATYHVISIVAFILWNDKRPVNKEKEKLVMRTRKVTTKKDLPLPDKPILPSMPTVTGAGTPKKDPKARKPPK